MQESMVVKLGVAVCALGLALVSGAGPALAQAQSPAKAPDYEETKATLWALEQSIYAGRAKGTMAAYAANQSPYYRAWPVGWGPPPPKPVPGAPPLNGAHEQLQMTFVDMAYNGHTAVMMYKDHRTRLPDGTPVDQYFEVTHIWSKEDGQWRLLAARPQAVQPPGM
jgi:hypothetical protein